MPLKRDQIVLPALPSEVVPVESLGGEVLVRGLRLGERLWLFAELRAAGKSFSHIAKVLTVVVIDEDGNSLLTEKEWEDFGGRNFNEALALFEVAKRLCGLDAEVVAKN